MKPANNPRLTAAELRARAEAAFQAKATSAVANSITPTPKEARALLHELQVHQIELEMQNDELQRSQHELATSHARYLDLYDFAPVGYCTISEKGLITKANLTLATLLGVTRSTLTKRLFSRYIQPIDQDEFYLLRRQLLAASTVAAIRSDPFTITPATCELRLVKSDGTDCWTQLAVTLVADEQGEKTLHIAVSDISARQAAQKRIEFLAHHDALTGLPNRLLAKAHLEQAILAAECENSRVALLFIDLDNFKSINNSHGHVIGDGLLKGVAIRLRECLRNIDTLSRQGGDEFLLVLNNMRDTASISVVAEKILERMAELFEIDTHELSVSLSIGIAVYPDDGKDFETLLKQSDIAMYHAKDSGRNTYRFHTAQMNADATEHLRMRNGLRRALEHGEFVLHYQPQISLATGAVMGAEALIRWHHPELGMVPPGDFISVAEDSGLIVPIGDWVLREACRQAVAWHKAGLPELRIAVNLSAVQFKRGDVEKSVIQALAESGLNPALLELELTESILLKDTEKVLATVRRLKSLGVKLSIDDFGTGYSSLSYLKRFDVDKLKIDQSFVRGMADDPSDAAIVSAIIQMAKSLNLTTVAEGVEDERQLSLLRLQHCDEAQGYHFARPLPTDEFENFVLKLLLLPAKLAFPSVS